MIAKLIEMPLVRDSYLAHLIEGFQSCERHGKGFHQEWARKDSRTRERQVAVGAVMVTKVVMLVDLYRNQANSGEER